MIRLRLIPWWGWALGGAAMCIALLLLYRSQLQKAEARGYDRAKVECEQAAQAQAEAWADQVRKADERAAKAATRIDKAERASRERIKQHYAEAPSACGITPPGISLLWQSDSERAATAATGRGYALRKAPAAPEGNGPE
jgi:hypothetical protein